METLADRSTESGSETRRQISTWWMWFLAGLVVGAGIVAVVQVSDTSNVERVADQWIAAIETQDMEALLPLYAEEVVWIDEALGDRFEGHSGIRVAWGIFSLRDFEVKEISVVAIGTDTATVRWTIAGSRSPFSGEPWATTGVSVLEISGAEITAETVYYDASGL